MLTELTYSKSRETIVAVDVDYPSGHVFATSAGKRTGLAVSATGGIILSNAGPA